MTNEQFYLTIGVPAFVALIGILVNVALFTHLSSVMGLRFDRMDIRIETLTGKVVDIDDRVIRIEDKLEIVPR